MTVKTVMLLTILYGYETWSGSLREERRSQVCENNAEESIQS